jgi:hypothetical protein
METNTDTPAGGHDGLAMLEAELMALSSNLAELQATLLTLLEAMQMQLALEVGAPKAGDQAVRWN